MVWKNYAGTMDPTLPQSESIKVRIRPHVFTLVRILFWWLVAILVPFLLLRLIGMHFDAPWLENQFVVATIGVYILLISASGILRVRNWLESNSYITNSRIVMVQSTFRKRLVWSVDFAAIESVAFLYRSRLAKLLQLGSIKIVAGTETAAMHELFRPERVANAILAHIDVVQSVQETVPFAAPEPVEQFVVEPLIIPAAVHEPVVEDFEQPFLSNVVVEQQVHIPVESQWIAPVPESIQMMNDDAGVLLSENEAVYF